MQTITHFENERAGRYISPSNLNEIWRCLTETCKGLTYDEYDPENDGTNIPGAIHKTRITTFVLDWVEGKMRTMEDGETIIDIKSFGWTRTHSGVIQSPHQVAINPSRTKSQVAYPTDIATGRFLNAPPY